MREAMRGRRREMGKSQQWVADAIGMTRPGYANIERGDKKPSAEALIALERVLDVPASILLENTKTAHETSRTHNPA